MEPKIQNLIIGLLIGVLATLLIANYSVNNQNYNMMRMMGMGRGVQQMMGDEDDNNMSMMHGEDMGMDEMVEELQELSGDEFDRRFIELMIEHHEGAIGMAELISDSTQRPELIKMGEDIISVQSAEIETMKTWLKDWFGQ
ncbi:hypothetical protein A2774_05575 [Candidatus Roizmanbacteria bacterium RIFCSPHIGHO2_01_FULL_39_12c]|uniref:DUF305 domain-containing protein n=1 Tax=Candidatus Roizmanbacteria bacterium RIFCSPHIGHO2_01_FULL_39_12c TaxID=1802031 RepID=A0A1F7GF16_9BACT|nr:MAG: hypothetical protein A2774_05575 [Candidatus Roizmanbacteria bacterium RIFCSPHIGHO2_01_FULL_39_12c]